MTFPYLSDGMWFLTQHKRRGLMKIDRDYLAIVQSINRIDIFKDAGPMAKVNVPKDPLGSSKLFDGIVCEGKDLKAYAASFKIRT